MNRKDFLRTSALATAGSLFLPQFLKALEGPGSLGAGERILVIVQLGGGNDGLNTVVNYRNDLYYQARPRLAISAKEVIPLNDAQGLHPALAPLQPHYDAGDLAILNSVGYPEPDRSHFRSMDIWQTASAADTYLETGWLGRYLDGSSQEFSRPTAAIEVGNRLSLALKGKQIKGLALSDPQRFHATAATPWFRAISQAHSQHDHANSQAAYLYKTLAASISSAKYIFETTRTARNRVEYPTNPLAHSLKTTAQMILAGLDTRVFYVDTSGFDTHVNQAGKHERLLSNYAQAMDAFAKDLKAGGRWKDVAILTFSEFGRRVAQNASGGTDHGTANNVFVMGGQLGKSGILNAAPDLADLDQGDLKYQVDFRQVYAELLG
ncbi:MAG TPA: DUF1501 domain-containing protein, partial [Bacteroidetes bacterium]|nr:DUF1501 domain-containing protein [Bacteroidota bacterium]